jgi:hypothetical protein
VARILDTHNDRGSHKFQPCCQSEGLVDEAAGLAPSQAPDASIVIYAYAKNCSRMERHPMLRIISNAIYKAVQRDGDHGGGASCKNHMVGNISGPEAVGVVS